MKIVKLQKETNEIQRVVTLRNSRNKRHRYQEFLLEGRAAIDEAYSKGWKIKSLFYNKDIKLSPWAKIYLEKDCCEVAYEISKELMDVISDRTESAELLAIAEIQVRDFNLYKPSLTDVIVVLDEPKSAGNLGMMIRSAVAFGVNAIVLSGHAADEFDPQCIRASVGTFFSIPIYRVDGVSKFSEKLEEIRLEYQGTTVIATGDKGAIPLPSADLKGGPLFLILGNETHGISVGYRNIASEFVKIPLPGKFTSLNIAAAGSIFLYEIFRCRDSES